MSKYKVKSSQKVGPYKTTEEAVKQIGDIKKNVPGVRISKVYGTQGKYFFRIVKIYEMHSNANLAAMRAAVKKAIPGKIFAISPA